MQKLQKNVSIIVFFFTITIVFIIGMAVFNVYHANNMQKITKDIYNHPLKVSNAALKIKLDILRIHRDMKDIVLSSSKKEIINLAKDIKITESRVYKNLKIIEQNILGDAGLEIQKQTKELFTAWKPIRDEVISLVNNQKLSLAVNITRGKGAQHVQKMESYALKLCQYAHNKADKFIKNSNIALEEVKNSTLSLTLILLIAFIVFISYIIAMLKKNISKIHESEVKFRGLFENSKASIWNEDLTEIVKSLEELRKDGITDLHKHLTQNIELVKELATKVKVTDVNNATLKLFNANSKNDFLSRIDTTFGNNAIYIFIDVLEAIWNKKESFTKEAIFKTLDGRDIHGIITFQIPEQLEQFLSISVSIIDVTDFKKVEKELKNSKARFKALHDASSGGIVIHDKGVILECNLRLAKLFGYSYDELINMDGLLLISKESLPTVIDNIENGYEEPYEAIGITKDGKKFPMSIEAREIIYKDKKTRVTEFNDLTNIKKVERELEISNDKFEKAFNKTPNLISITDLETGKIFEVNQTFENVLGYKKEDIVGKTSLELNIWTSQKERDKFTNSFNDKGFIRDEIYSVRTKHGDILTVRFFASNIIIDNKGYILSVAEDITERKKAENLLNKNEKILNLIIDNSPIGICTVDLLGNFVSTNPAYEKMLGYSKKELSEFSFFDVTHPDYRPKNKELFQKMFSLKESSFNMEKVYIRKDGKKIDVSVHATGVSDETGNIKFGTAFVEDITERKHNLMLLEEKKNELETIILEAPNPIMLHNEDGKIILINKIWKKLTGYSYKEIDTIKKWVKKAHRDKVPAMKEHIDTLYEIKQQTFDGEYEVATKNNNKIIWQFNSAPLGTINGSRTIITTAMDITELKQKDELLIKQSRHAAMGEMISMIAHQWRQPLSVIGMSANNMLIDIGLENFSLAASEEYANDISRQTQNLSKTIDDFRNFFKPDNIISKINIKDVLNKALSIIKDSLKNNNIKLTSSFETNKQVNAYPRELMQVLINIITNSKDALKSNKIKNGLISVRVYEDKKYINTDICDNAGGIDKEILPKIFDPYFSTKDEKTGTGLGLYMSKMIVEEHLNGIIKASNKNDGVCFTIRLLKD